MQRCANKANGFLRKSEVVAAFSEDRNEDPKEYLRVLAVDMRRLFHTLDAGLSAFQDWD
jgi:ribulose bisphosphate carboxylase small subunit